MGGFSFLEMNAMHVSMRIFVLAATLIATSVGPAFAQDVVVDNDAGPPGFTTVGTWTQSVSSGWNGGTYVFVGGGNPSLTATWHPTLPAAGNYEVLAAFLASANRTPRAPHTVAFAGGTAEAEISQVGTGIREVSLGVYPFAEGTAGQVTLTGGGDPGAHIADAMIFRPAPAGPPIIGDISQDPGYAFTGQAVTLRCRITPCMGAAITSATVDVAVWGETTRTLVLYDDGAHNDGAANDGTYAAQLDPLAADAQVSFVLRATDDAARNALPRAGGFHVQAHPTAEWRCIWVTSWGVGFLDEAQAQDLVDTCRAANINTLLLEVRKVGDAYYNSALEPRGTNITGGPGFDPLARVIALAHDTSGGKRRLQVHAWFVSHRVRNGETLAPGHVLSRHPEYAMLRADGTEDPQTSYLDPGHPGAVDHNTSVILDCLANYDIDGINLDYIRYPGGTEYGYNPTSLARFNALNGRTGDPATTDTAWSDWRRECVTLEVRKGYVKAWQMKPRVVFSTCGISTGAGTTLENWTSSSTYRSVFQDWIGWLRAGIIDYSMPMNYKAETETVAFRACANMSFAADDGRGTIIGISPYRHVSIGGTIDQLLWVRHNGGGMNLFAWRSEVTGNTEGATRAQFYDALRTQVYPSWLDPPQPAWKYAPTVGILEGTVTMGGEPVDHASVEVVGLPGSATVTDGSGWFGILNVPPGNHTLRATPPGGSETTIASATMVDPGSVVTVNMNLGAAAVGHWAKY
jgi:uncharacterized lipoprotein YddW (UPF0748 family)